MIVSLFSSFDPLNIRPLNSVYLACIRRLIILSASMAIGAPSSSFFNTLTQSLLRDYDVNAPKGSHLFVCLFPILCLQIGTINFIGLGLRVFTASSRLAFALSLAAIMWMSRVVLIVEKSVFVIFSHLVPLGCPVIW